MYALNTTTTETSSETRYMTMCLSKVQCHSNTETWEEGYVRCIRKPTMFPDK